MKHTGWVTITLIALFVVAQLVGLGILATGMNVSTNEDGTIEVDYDETIIGERPETEGIASLLYLLVGVAIGTVVLLVLARFNQQFVWKLWFFIAVWITIAIALGEVINPWLAGGIALALAAWKILRPNIIVHNVSELFIYTGIAVLLVPIFDVFWACMLLIAIAIYDAIAVWQSKHMISLAQFQTESKMFAGLQLSYTPKAAKKVAAKPAKTTAKKTTKTKTKMVETKSAILGGGDIAFPLIFTGTILQWLITKGYTKLAAFGISSIVIATSAIALTALFVYAKKDKFYPAMPFLGAGCFIGLAIVAVIV